MKASKFLVVLIAALSISFANYAQKSDSTSTKLLGKLFGTWQVQNVTKGKTTAKAVASDQNYPQSIKFTVDAKYVMSRGAVKIDSGSFNTNEGTSSLYLQSATDKDHLQEWKADLKSNTALTLIGKKGSRMDGVKLECTKKE